MPLENINNIYLIPNPATQYFQPDQAYVEAIIQADKHGSFVFWQADQTQATSFDVGISGFEQRILNQAALGDNPIAVSFQAHGLNQASINAIMAGCIDVAPTIPGGAVGILSIQDGTNAVPQGADVTALQGLGWTVHHNM